MNETKQETYPHLELPPTLGDTNFQTACVLAEMHMQNELLYALLAKKAKNSPVPSQDDLNNLITFFLDYLDDPLSRDKPCNLPLRQYIRADGTHDNVTLLENLRAREATEHKGQSHPECPCKTD
jgi:hypothetical protein